jgi:glycosyltransferase involved in cell wall biosynthesis
VVDDGSTDESASIVETMLCEVMRLQGYKATRQEDGKAEDALPNRLIAQLPYRLLKQKNAGVSAARNYGFSVSIGDYIAFLDADDWWEPTYLEKMAQLIEDYPEAGLYACNYYYHKDGRNIIKVDIPTGYFNYPKEYFKNFAMPVTSISVVIPLKVYDTIGGFPLGIKLGEDFLLWVKIAMQYKVVFLNEPLAYYNNTLPPMHRATYKLHNPNEHMLFRLDQLGNKAIQLLNEENNDWRRLIDMLRIHGLYSYWLSDEYHEIAQKELDKVCWKDQHDFLVKMYDKPRWYLQMKQRLVRIASRLKHKFK